MPSLVPSTVTSLPAGTTSGRRLAGERRARRGWAAAGVAPLADAFCLALAGVDAGSSAGADGGPLAGGASFRCAGALAGAVPFRRAARLAPAAFEGLRIAVSAPSREAISLRAAVRRLSIEMMIS